MKKLALFDFCETLVDFQTAGPYVDFIRLKTGSEKMQRLEKMRILLKKIRVTAVINKLFPWYSFDKRLKLFQLKGFSRSTLEKYAEIYYRSRIVPEMIPDLLNEMNKLKAGGYTITIISGGYSIYLDSFAKDHQIDHVIASEIAFNSKEICTGKLKGTDCMYHYKIDKLKDHFFPETIVAKESVFYSDSITDLPLLLWAGQAVVVSKEKKQSWAASHGLNEIVWKKENSIPAKIK